MGTCISKRGCAREPATEPDLAFCGRLGCVLGASWVRLGGVWGRLGASWDCPESVLKRLGASLAVLGRSWDRFEDVLYQTDMFRPLPTACFLSTIFRLVTIVRFESVLEGTILNPKKRSKSNQHFLAEKCRFEKRQIFSKTYKKSMVRFEAVLGAS